MKLPNQQVKSIVWASLVDSASVSANSQDSAWRELQLCFVHCLSVHDFGAAWTILTIAGELGASVKLVQAGEANRFVG